MNNPTKQTKGFNMNPGRRPEVCDTPHLSIQKFQYGLYRISFPQWEERHEPHTRHVWTGFVRDVPNWEELTEPELLAIRDALNVWFGKNR